MTTESRPQLRHGSRRSIAQHAAWALLLVLAAGCDSTGPGPVPPPPPPPPPPSPIDGLWTSSGVAPAILRLGADQLLESGTVEPAIDISTPSAELFNLNAVAFDADGTLWVTSPDDSLVLAFRPGDLETSGSKPAAVVLSGTGRSLSAPEALAFDREHRLWVANYETGTLVRFDRAQLAASGAPAPAVVISGVGQPRALAFDAAGSLWVTDVQGPRIVRYGAAQLTASGAPAPEVVIGAGNSLSIPSGLAFDAAGNLWVANPGHLSVVAFAPDQLAASGTPTPRIVLSATPSSPEIPAGLAFDAEGSLWVMGLEGVLVKYDRTLLGQSAAPAPTVRLDLGDSLFLWSLAFWPRPAGLPLN